MPDKVVGIEKERDLKRRKPERKPERLTPVALMELISRHSNCVHDQGKTTFCPLVIFTQAMCWELNTYFGVGNEEDAAFRRYDEMPAAKPLSDHSAEEEER